MLDPRVLSDEPHVEDAMRAAGFELDPANGQPGAWINPDGIPVDLMVPDALGGVGRRGARVPPHSKHALRKATGLEAVVVDHRVMDVSALTADDPRVYTINVASPAALLVAKLHKLGDRQGHATRLEDKDAHDIYRLLTALPSEQFSSLRWLSSDALAGDVTRRALRLLQRLFASGPDAVGSQMAGRAEEGIGDRDVVAASVAALAGDVLALLNEHDSPPE